MKVTSASFIMAKNKLQNYLRTHRKRSSLSQEEVAFLLGCRSGAKVSRYESFARQPTIQTIFAYELIFGAHARELFAGLFQDIERETLRRVEVLHLKLQQAKTRRRTNQKLEFLQTINLESNSNPDNSE
jgi:transcriptional regulator with XRE-family HTH domain